MKKSIKIFLVTISFIGFLSLAANVLGHYGIYNHLPESMGDLSEFFDYTLPQVTNDIKRVSINEIHENENISNIVLFGIDSYNPSLNQMTRSDCIKILTIDNREDTIKITSILRDTLVYIPEKNDYNRINTAIVYEPTIDDAIKVIEDVLDTKIDGFIIVNYKSIINLIDDMDGIFIHIDKNEKEWLNNILENINIMDKTSPASPFIKSIGYQQINGKQALAYMRIRQNGGDVMRLERQKEITQYLYKKINRKNKTELLKILSNFKNNTINDITITQILSIMKYFNNRKNLNIENITLPKEESYEISEYKEMSVIITDIDEIARDFHIFIDK